MKKVLILLMIISLALCPATAFGVEDEVTEEIASQEEVNNQEVTEDVPREEASEETAEDAPQEDDLEETVQDVPQEEASEEITEDVPPEKNTKLITELYAFNASLYFCDTPTNRVVLRGVNPAQENENTKAMAKEAENLEIRISPDGLYMNDGTKLNIEDLNFYADSEVWLIIARTEEGNLIIPYFQFRAREDKR